MLRSLAAAVSSMALFFTPMVLAAAPQSAPAADEKLTRALQTLDERSRTFGDYKATVLAEVKRASGGSNRQLQLFRRDTENKMVILTTAPKTEAGKGYLSAEDNLWFYDASVGRWERRTVREAISGTDGHADDFEPTHWASRYLVESSTPDKLGGTQVQQVDLKAKEDARVAFTRVKLWVDVQNGNLLKRQDFSENGKLLRTVLSPKWTKVHSPSKKGDFWYPDQTLVYDELVKGNATRFVITSVDLRPLQPSVFTKGWLEARSR